jgi:hypothetical protein
VEEIYNERGGDVTWGVITFDGGGGFTFNFDNIDSEANSNLTAGHGDYSVSSSGYVEITFTQIDNQSCCITARGHFSDGGQIMNLSDMNDCSDRSGPSDDGRSDSGGGGGCFIRLIDEWFL